MLRSRATRSLAGRIATASRLDSLPVTTIAAITSLAILSPSLTLLLPLSFSNPLLSLITHIYLIITSPIIPLSFTPLSFLLPTPPHS
jgi:hypothetical protein